MLDEKRERLRLRAKTDGLWLGNKVLGYDFQQVPHEGLFNCYLQKDPEKPLLELSEVKNRLILWPRGTFKTSGSAVEAVQLILDYPDIRIGVLSANLQEAKKRVTESKSAFVSSAKMRQLYPEYCFPEKAKAECSRFVSPARVRRHLREATMEVLSPRAIKAGKHFDVIFVDDLVNEINSKNPEQLAKALNDFRSFVPLLDQGGYLYVTGTPYSFDDVYAYIQEQIRSERLTHWLVSKRTCWIERCSGCGHSDVRHLDGGGACSGESCDCKKFEASGTKEVLFPQVRTTDGRTIGTTVESLLAILGDIGPEDFACQYLCNPLAASERKFTRELIYSRMLPPHMVPQKGAAVVVVDLAYSKKNQSDQTVMMVARVKGGRNYLVDILVGRMDPDQQVETLFQVMLKWRPRKIYIEFSTAAEYLLRMVTAFARQHGILHVPVEILPADNRKDAKFHRVLSVRTALVQDRLKLAIGLPFWELVENQLLVFPKRQRHDDAADCLGLLVNAPTGYEHVPLAPETKLPWFLRAKASEEVVEGSGLPFGING